MKAKSKKVLKIVAIVLAALIVAGAVATGIYFGVQSERCSGYVRDAEGAPMEGVSVTNGRQVVKTDENGHYVLDGWLKDRFVTVTIPSGYWTEDYYLEIGSAREGYDFTLEKLDEDLTDHTFLQVSDSEVGEDGVGDWIENVKEAADDSGAAFIMHTGDICYEAGLKSHINGMNSENMGVPVRYAIGNHDYVKWGSYAEDLYESTYGPVCYSFEVGNVHYIVTPIVHGADYLGRYTNADVWRWVKNDLENTSPDKKVVMFNHDYCTSDEDGFVVSYGAGKKLDLKEHGLIAWIYGHWHYDLMYKTDCGVFNICTGQPQGGGIDSTLPAVRSVSIEGGELVSSHMYYYDFDGAEPQEGCDWTVNIGGEGQFAEPIVSGDYVYADTFASPQRGDIIVINAQDDSGEWHTIIKRLIAEQGQSVELKEGVLYVNGEYVEESYVLPQNNFPDLPINNYGPVTVPEGCVFVLGDNRNVSSDSRGKYGMIDKDNIVGVVTVWSMTMKSFITGWNTFFEYTVPSIF